MTSAFIVENEFVHLEHNNKKGISNAMIFLGKIRIKVYIPGVFILWHKHYHCVGSKRGLGKEGRREDSPHPARIPPML